MKTSNQLTPEQRAMLNEIVNGAFSSIAIHFIGDHITKGIRHVADATQASTNVTARWAGTAQVMAAPAIRHAASAVTAPILGFSGRIAAGVSAGYRAATLR